VGTAPAITLVVTAPSATGSFQNTAGVATTASDPGGANNSSSIGTFTFAVYDLAVTIADSPDPVVPGGTLTYTATVTNLGPSAATDVPLEVFLPSDVTFVSATGPGWTCSESGGDVNCFLADLAAGASSSVTIVVIAPPVPTTLSTTAECLGEISDPNLSNNVATADTTVAEPDTCSVDALIAAVSELSIDATSRARLLEPLLKARTYTQLGVSRLVHRHLGDFQRRVVALRSVRKLDAATADAFIQCAQRLILDNHGGTAPTSPNPPVVREGPRQPREPS